MLGDLSDQGAKVFASVTGVLEHLLGCHHTIPHAAKVAPETGLLVGPVPNWRDFAVDIAHWAVFSADEAVAAVPEMLRANILPQ